MYFTWAAAISSVIFNLLHVISFQEWHSTQCPQTADTNEWDELFRETLCEEAAWFYVMTIAYLMGAGVLIVGAAKVSKQLECFTSNLIRFIARFQTSFSLLYFGLGCYFLNVCLGLLAFRLDFIEKSSLLAFVGGKSWIRLGHRLTIFYICLFIFQLCCCLACVHCSRLSTWWITRRDLNALNSLNINQFRSRLRIIGCQTEVDVSRFWRDWKRKI